MRNFYCYMPILPARGGAFLATQWLSPDTESRLTPLFDIPDPVVRVGDTLEAHFYNRAKGDQRILANGAASLRGHV